MRPSGQAFRFARAGEADLCVRIWLQLRAAPLIRSALVALGVAQLSCGMSVGMVVGTIMLGDFSDSIQLSCLVSFVSLGAGGAQRHSTGISGQVITTAAMDESCQNELKDYIILFTHAVLHVRSA